MLLFVLCTESISTSNGSRNLQNWAIKAVILYNSVFQCIPLSSFLPQMAVSFFAMCYAVREQDLSFGTATRLNNEKRSVGKVSKEASVADSSTGNSSGTMDSC